MTPERWRQIRDLFDAVVPLDADARRQSFDAACAGDPELRLEVESLLASHLPPGAHFLDTPVLRTSLVAPFPRAAAGRRAGAYELLEIIGHGGMGEVYRARRADGHYDQQVAVKLIRGGAFQTDRLIERFRTERQILARLDHPNIARLLDGGTLDDGTPFLAMELVEGTAIDAYCAAHDLTLRQRMQLFLRVCAAVEYAHQRLVVHRDIKPSNILVTSDGTPKLLDFGIARILDTQASADATAVGPLTPEYASPEQIGGKPVTTGTDVYSLGVVLYRLLTGRSPYPGSDRSPATLARAIVETEPQPPSAVAANCRPLEGDLDAIILKALRKEPQKRYASVEQFAADVRRHLDGLPVMARAGTWRYRAGKFAHRHLPAVVVAATVLAALLAAVAITAREARIAEANRRRADARFADVRRLATSLLFEVHESIQNLPGATKARSLILQRSLEYLDRLAAESEHDPDLKREVATAYDRVADLQGDPLSVHLGETTEAVASYRKSIALWESLVRANRGSHRDQISLAEVYNDYAGFLSAGTGDVTRGLEYGKQALAILDREAQASPNDSHVFELTLRTLTTLGMLQEGTGLIGRAGTVQEGLEDLNRALRMTQRAIERSPTDTQLEFRLGTLELAIGESLLKLGDRPDAWTHYRRSIGVFDVLVRDGVNLGAAFNRAVAYTKLGDVLLIDGKTAGAVSYYQEGLASASRLAAAEPRNESVLRIETIALSQLGHAWLEIGRTDAAMPLLLKAVAKVKAEKTGTPLARSIEALVRGWYGEALERQGRIGDAAREYLLVKQRIEAVRAGGINYPRLQGYLGAASDRLAATFVKRGDLDTAMSEYEKTRRMLEPLAAANPDEQEIAYVLAETYTAEGAIAASRADRARNPTGRLAAWRDAVESYRKSLATWSAVPHPARVSTSGFEVTLPADVSARLVHAERAMKRLQFSDGGAAEPEHPR